MSKHKFEVELDNEYWKAVRAHFNEQYKQRRQLNTVSSTQILINGGIVFEERNKGAHLIVSTKNSLFPLHPLEIIDFWPSTGLWHTRTTKLQRRGVRPLLKYIHKVWHKLDTKDD